MRLDISQLPDDLRVVIGAQGTAIGEIIDTGKYLSCICIT